MLSVLSEKYNISPYMSEPHFKKWVANKKENKKILFVVVSLIADKGRMFCLGKQQAADGN